MVLVKPRLIAGITHDEIFSALREGKKLAFVDAREQAEYAEERLPMARNLQLRGVNAGVVAPLRDYDILITYCIKDFRGFELGRALQRQGLTNVRVMQDPGLRGWKYRGLPVAGEVPKRTDQEALEQLMQCAALGACPKKG